MYHLDHTLIEIVSSQERARWNIRHAFEGTQIFGGIGSGKTSGSGRKLALKYLGAGFGGLVLTVKPDEKELWQQYCRQTGRERDLLILEPGSPHFFNFLEYEASQSASSLTENLVEVLRTVIRASDAKDAGRSDDSFWETALDMLMFNVIDLCKLAYGELSLQDLYDIAQSIPKTKEELQSEENAEKAFQLAMKAANERVNEQIENWYLTLSAREHIEMEDNALFQQKVKQALPDARLLSFLDQFFVDTYIPISEKTRSIIDFIFSGCIFRLLREPIYSLFCRGKSTITPEDSQRGKIILINLPVKIYHKVGRDCQILFKYLWQRTMEKRRITPDSRPVFLWADEAQNFLHEHDADYQATARSSRIATVYISQNLPNYYACMGGQKAEYRVKSFLGTLGTKIFHANADIETNKYASELFGDAFFEDESESTTYSQNFGKTKSKSLKLERMVRPEEFVKLRTGGPLNNFQVEGYLHRQGDALLKGLNQTKMVFNQNS